MVSLKALRKRQKTPWVKKREPTVQGNEHMSNGLSSRIRLALVNLLQQVQLFVEVVLKLQMERVHFRFPLSTV